MVLSLIFGSLLLLTALAFHQLRGDILHPAVVFPFVWGVTIIIIGLTEPFGYIQISLGALLMFLLGNIFLLQAHFSVRGVLPPKIGCTKIIWISRRLSGFVLHYMRSCSPCPGSK